MELEKREGEIQREIATINIRIARRTIKEWFDVNKEKTKEYKKDYYQTNMETLKEQNKEYRENNKEKYLDNRKQNYLKNYKKIICECGCEIVQHNLSIHQQTKKHLDLIADVATVIAKS